MARPAIEFTPYTDFPLEPVSGPAKGLSQRIIVRDEKGRALVRVLQYEPGTDTTPNGVAVHDYWEEVFIVEGSTYDITLGREFPKGSVASRPPGMRHGPWRSPNGCVMYEVNYYYDE